MNSTFGTLDKITFVFSGLSDHTKRGEFSIPLEGEEKVEKHSVIINTGANSLEMNNPISMRMSDRNIRK